MFDTVSIDKVIRCECTYRPKDFQTKSLDSTLDNFKIVKGQLYKNECSYRFAERHEQVQLGKLWLPLTVAEAPKWVKSNYTGTIDMYDYCDKCKKLLHVYMILLEGKVKSMQAQGTK